MVTKRHPKPAALHKYTEAEGDCKSTIKMVLDCKSSTTRDKIVFRKFPKKQKGRKLLFLDTFDIFGYVRDKIGFRNFLKRRK